MNTTTPRWLRNTRKLLILSILFSLGLGSCVDLNAMKRRRKFDSDHEKEARDGNNPKKRRRICEGEQEANSRESAENSIDINNIDRFEDDNLEKEFNGFLGESRGKRDKLKKLKEFYMKKCKDLMEDEGEEKFAQLDGSKAKIKEEQFKELSEFSSDVEVFKQIGLSECDGRKLLLKGFIRKFIEELIADMEKNKPEYMETYVKEKMEDLPFYFKNLIINYTKVKTGTTIEKFAKALRKLPELNNLEQVIVERLGDELDDDIFSILDGDYPKGLGKKVLEYLKKEVEGGHYNEILRNPFKIYKRDLSAPS